jgi:hypothetical protein
MISSVTEPPLSIYFPEAYNSVEAERLLKVH